MSITSGAHIRIVFDQTETEDSGAAGHLRSLKRLTIVELEFPIQLIILGLMSTEKREVHKAQIKALLTVWKTHLIPILRDSPSKERKFLRWKVSGNRSCRDYPDDDIDVVLENGELEVLPP